MATLDTNVGDAERGLFVSLRLSMAKILLTAGGLLGGLFSRLMIASLSGSSPDRVSRWRARRPVLFAAACGLGVALIGAAFGNDVALLLYGTQVPALIALGMVGFLAAATQAPLTAFIIVMEMVDGHAMVLSLMACALIAFAVARLISPPLYPTLARLQLRRTPHPTVAPEQPPSPD
jgi:H+/Cl- antiporter ClcA